MSGSLTGKEETSNKLPVARHLTSNKKLLGWRLVALTSPVIVEAWSMEVHGGVTDVRSGRCFVPNSSDLWFH